MVVVCAAPSLDRLQESNTTLNKHVPLKPFQIKEFEVQCDRAATENISSTSNLQLSPRVETGCSEANSGGCPCHYHTVHTPGRVLIASQADTSRLASKKSQDVAVMLTASRLLNTQKACSKQGRSVCAPPMHRCTDIRIYTNQHAAWHVTGGEHWPAI